MWYNTPAVREDYYELLEVPAAATKQELRSAYHRLAMRYHPDHNGDNPAAEERFKLIAEAWRTLSDPEKRAEYDDWLERHKRYAHMPELATMRRRTRVSVHRSESRREGRRSAATSRRPRFFLLRRRSKGGMVYHLIIYLCFLFSMVPYFTQRLSSVHPRRADAAAAKPTLPPGESTLSPEEQKKNLELYLKQLTLAAEEGDALAQYRYGCLLYLGSIGVEQNRAEALHWWAKSAEQGNALAKQALKREQTRKNDEQTGEPMTNGDF